MNVPPSSISYKSAEQVPITIPMVSASGHGGVFVWINDEYGALANVRLTREEAGKLAERIAWILATDRSVA